MAELDPKIKMQLINHYIELSNRRDQLSLPQQRLTGYSSEYEKSQYNPALNLADELARQARKDFDDPKGLNLTPDKFKGTLGVYYNAELQRRLKLDQMNANLDQLKNLLHLETFKNND